VAATTDDFAYIRDLFAAFGPVVVRRMFGGAGIYAEGTMFAILDDGVIYLKADEAAAPGFRREGSMPFTYENHGRQMVMSYWRLPERLYDDPDELARWARRHGHSPSAPRQPNQSRPARDEGPLGVPTCDCHPGGASGSGRTCDRRRSAPTRWRRPRQTARARPP